MNKKPKAAPTAATSPKKLPKKIIALSYLLNRSLIELEALNLFGDTCLHSTISELSNRHGLEFKRVREKHQHQGGGITHFTRYTLVKESQPAALELVARYIGRTAA